MNQFKRKLTAFTAMLAFLSLSSAATFALDTTDANVLGKTGNMEFDHSLGANRTDVNINDVNGAVGQVDWKEFSVNSNEHVNFGFSGLSQTIINRVLGGKTSTIMGKMTSSCMGNGACESYNNTGKVIFINPAGMLFGNGSQVDINSFTASTFDMKNAQNLKGLSGAALQDYQNNVLNKASATHNTITVGGVTYHQGEVVLDSNYQDAFNTANNGSAIQYDANATKAIKLDGATFSHWARTGNQFDFNTELSASPNKSIAFVSNNIDYKDSLIRTGLNYNYTAVSQDGNGNTVSTPYSYSNVKLITADGVTFNYLGNGYIDYHEVASTDNHSDVARTITMDNSGLLAADPSKEAIVAGEVDIEQRAGVANGAQASVKIKDTIIKGMKLVNRENGDIVITASQDILVDHSRLETDNTTAISAIDGSATSTIHRHGGEVYISGDKNVTVKDSTVITSGSLGTVAYADNSGAIRINAGEGTAKVEGSKLLADGYTKVQSDDKVDIDNSILQAYNTTDTTTEKDVVITGPNGVKINNTDMNSKGDIKILAGHSSTGKLTGNVEITGDNTKTIAENDANQPIIKAKKSINIQGKNTSISNTTLAYNEANGLKFYDATKSGDDYTNNVVIKDNTAFSPYAVNASGKEIIADDVTIETNGNLTFDNAKAQRAEYAIKFDRQQVDANGNIIATGYNLDSAYDLHDDGSVDGIHFITKDNPMQLDAVNLNIKSTNGNVTVQNGSNINASNNTTVLAQNGNYNQTSSTVSAGNDITITAKTAGLDSSTVQGGNNATIHATTGNINVTGSSVLALTGNAELTADANNANINIESKTTSGTTRKSNVEAGNDTKVTAKKNVTINNSNVIAGSDAAGYDVTHDAQDNIGTVEITADTGSVSIKDNSKINSFDKDVKIIANDTITFGAQGATGVNIDKTTDITAKNKVLIQSKSNDIVAEKTTMPTIKYGEDLTFNAGKNNIITSQDSLKSVNVNYIAGDSNKFYTQGDIQFVNSTLESPKNFIESGKDVILNNLTINDATTNPKDTVTEIYANGNVTTYNVTGETLGAKDSGDYYTYPQNVSSNRVAKNGQNLKDYNSNLQSTNLDINQTKLKVQTDTVKDANNPDNGSITLVLKNADNTNAGLELKAQNVTSLNQDPTTGDFKQGYYKTGTPEWDNNIAEKEGPEIHLNATDGAIAVKELYSDKLTLDVNDRIFADDTTGTPVITVKDRGGLSIDPYVNYTDGTPQGFTYDQNYDTTNVNTTGGVLTFGEWSDWAPTGQTWTDANGVVHTIYDSTRDGNISDKITTQTDQRHTITFDNNGNPGEFTLVYDKTSTTVEPGRDITAQNVKDNPITINNVTKPNGDPATPSDFIKTMDDTCEPTPDVDRRDENGAIPLMNGLRTTLPRETVEISKTSTVADNTADQTANIMSAAAKVDLGQEIDASYDDDNNDLDADE
ncbi:MAG: filamentous hemagglutinin N-terminal domain-containing protein [Candidatus Gastranaerophilales bacterium]|nr:filamentous hemagglutinin N-terminal domain-containing protein [Candidatus Gastranaerophilales bacterium]